MKDPGLFSGVENVTYNETVAARLYGTWAKLSMEFLAAIWADFEFNDENAEVFTIWIMSEFLPSFPKNIQIRPPQQGKFFVDVLIGYYLPSIMTIKKKKRAQKALLSFINCLAISKEEYLKQVMNLLGYFQGPNSEENKEYKKAILSFLLRHIKDIDARSIVFLHKHNSS